MSSKPFPSVPGCTLRVVFMFDNHTFARVTEYPASNPREDALDAARLLFEQDGAGALFARWWNVPDSVPRGESTSLMGSAKPPVIPEGDEWFGSSYGVLRSSVEGFLEKARLRYEEYVTTVPPRVVVSPLDVVGPSGDCLHDFHEDNWWVPELKSMLDLPGVTHDQKRAVFVVLNLLATIKAAEEYEKEHKA